MGKRKGSVTVEIPSKLTSVFAGPARYRCAYGGRGSGKSYTFAKMAAIRGYANPLRILCTRELQNSIKDSVHAEIKRAIYSEPWLEKFYDVGETYIRGRNGTEFLFKGLRLNYQEIKSTAGVGICWIEEASAVSDESWETLIPTIREPNSEIWVTWNPYEEMDPVHQRFIEKQPSALKIAEVNWRDNPWFPAVLEQERQDCKRDWPEEIYEHIWEGKVKRESDPWQVIPTAWVEAAMKRWQPPTAPQTALGVDVARGGKDETILAPLHGWHYGELITYPGKSTPDGASVAAQVQQHLTPGSAAYIDVVGVGSSVYDHCTGLEAYPVSAGTKAEDPRGQRYTDKSGQLEFKNLRSWMTWRFRELLDPDGGVDIALPPDSRLKADLCAPRWKMEPPLAGSKAQGRIVVESKDKVKERIGRSPDRGDAVQYAAIGRDHFAPDTTLIDKLSAMYG